MIMKTYSTPFKACFQRWMGVTISSIQDSKVLSECPFKACFQRWMGVTISSIQDSKVLSEFARKILKGKEGKN